MLSPLRNLHFSLLWLMGVEAETPAYSSQSQSQSQSQGGDAPRPSSIGGQAVIEGVMMRSPKRLAVAVRAPDGEIVVDNRTFTPYSKRYKILSWPILRGAASLVESLAMGLRALNFSVAVQERGQAALAASKASAPLANPDITAPSYSAKESNASSSADVSRNAVSDPPTSAAVSGGESFQKPASAKDKLLIAGSLAFSFALAMALFQFLPYFVSGQIIGGDKTSSPNPVLFNALAGLVRMSLLLTYLWAIARLPDVARVFEYHGAEHKSIFLHENGGKLTADGAARESRFHPRCGTSFILIVALVCICFFSVFDAIVLQFGLHYPTFAHRFLAHLPFIPVVAGLAFEVLKLSARFQNSAIVRPLILPGLWLQRITTREPDARELDVAIASIKASLA